MDHFEMEKMKWSPRSTPIKGPARLCKFCLLAVALPIALLCIPLYMRFLALRPHILTLSPTDMKLLNQESKVSTSWCKAQTIRMNSSFNAYLLPDRPGLQTRRQSVSLERRMILEDDMKEYWGFYLLQGSKVRVDTCARYPGANIIVVKGVKDAKRCAWLGELDSEEESDEDSNESASMEEKKQKDKEEEKEKMGKEEEGFLFSPDAGQNSDEVVTSSREKTKFLMSRANAWSKETKLKVLGFLTRQLSNHSKTGEELLNILKPKIPHTRPPKKSSDVVVPGIAKYSENSTRHKISAILVRDDAEEDSGGEDAEDAEDGAPIDHLQNTGRFDQHNRPNLKKDKSNEEERSSWSSSEEALLRCEGLIHQYEFTGNTLCNENRSNSDMTSIMTMFYLNITKTGFYYFIFSNENEIKDNFLAANFDLQKTTFNLDNSEHLCLNSTECVLPLTFWSDQHIVIEVPRGDDSSSECDTEGVTNYHQCNYVVRAESVCEPRGAVYMVFLLLVPIIILTFAYI